MEDCGVFKGADLAKEGLGIGDGGAGLDEFFGAVEVTGEEIDFVAVGRFDVSDFGAATLEFDENGSFQ